MKKLEWDSNYWGIDVYHVNKKKDFDLKILLQKKGNKNETWLVQALLPINQVEETNSLENEGFKFIETKINMIKILQEKVDVDFNKFRKIKKLDLKDKKNVFFELYGRFSRFNTFDVSKVNNFYYLWVINSINGSMDDECIGYYSEDKLMGFITYKFQLNEVSIGLLGVFPEFQKKGISQQLLNYVNNEAIKKRYSKINVSTQGKNYNAINTYIKNGYIVNDIKNWYYLEGEYYDFI